MHWNKVALVGVGLLGGSLGLAVRGRGLADAVHGLVRRKETIEEAQRCGAVDHASLAPEEVIDGADLVVLCTPLSQMRTLTEACLPHLSAGTIVTDVGSVKGSVVHDLESLVAEGGGRFVGSHPMAGSEQSGVGAAQEGLFVDAPCVVTPTSRTDGEALAQVEALWQSVGGRVMRLEPEVHDALVCRVSHLPHVLAAALARYVLSPEFPAAQASLCATGFRDTTRVASGSPGMWRDICRANREPLSRMIESLMGQLDEFRARLAQKDPEGLEAFFKEAKERRDQWEQQWQQRGRSSPAE